MLKGRIAGMVNGNYSSGEHVVVLAGRRIGGRVGDMGRSWG